ncbi:MAG: A24 family peptidase [bacterium]|nr:A24 family peptidase [bacterium]
MPILVRAIVVALLALAAARFANWAIYSWAWNRKELGPWTPPKDAPPRSPLVQLPVLGWLLLRQEAPLHGKGYWIRPLLIELLFPVFVVWYYCQYVTAGMLPEQQVVTPLPAVLVQQLHWQFIAHFVLFTLMLVATFIDFDEQSIPDFCTVPGTVIGLLGAAFAPAWLPFHQSLPAGRPPAPPEELHAKIPELWPAWLDGTYGLLIGLLVVVVWGFALLDRRWITRRGFKNAVKYFFARLMRSRSLCMGVTAVTLLLLLLVSFAWTFLNAPNGRWPYLLSSLLGLAFAGGVTWAVRLSASAGLGVEALGFGDVTLMAMIGTYIGWQPSLLVFFIAPLVAILFVLLRAIITGDTATPYGPYLCAAAVILLVYWHELWTTWAARMFVLGPLILGILVACVVLMGVMLWIWRLIKQALGFVHH